MGEPPSGCHALFRAFVNRPDTSPRQEGQPHASTSPKTTRAALYARISTDSQTTDNQLIELRDYAERQGWAVTEYV